MSENLLAKLKNSNDVRVLQVVKSLDLGLCKLIHVVGEEDLQRYRPPTPRFSSKLDLARVSPAQSPLDEVLVAKGCLGTWLKAVGLTVGV